MLGVAGLDEAIRLAQAEAGLGLSGQPDLSNGSRRLGDRAADCAWRGPAGLVAVACRGLVAAAQPHRRCQRQ